MKVLEGLEAVPGDCKGAVLAIGNFDGVHRGHQALLAKTREIASKQPGTSAGVMIFEPHPREFFSPDQPHFALTTLQQRLGLLEIYGMDLAVVLPFDKQLAALEAMILSPNLLVGKLGVAHVVIGYDFFFGRKRGGNAELMTEAGGDPGVWRQRHSAGGRAAAKCFRHRACGRCLVRAKLQMQLPCWGIGGGLRARSRAGQSGAPDWGFPPQTYPCRRLRFWPMAYMVCGFILVQGRHHGAAYLGTRPTFDDGAAGAGGFSVRF